MARVECRALEWHVTHLCNLRCDNCSHFSNYGLEGMPSVEEADRQWGLWSSRLVPKRFALLGGEPTIHPDLVQLVYLARKHWPDSDLLLVSNGWFLERHPDLPKALEEANCKLAFSIHHDGPEYRAKVLEIVKVLHDWQLKHAFELEVRKSFDQWRRVFLRWGKYLKPYRDNDPQASWEACGSKWCMQLMEGKLYKCPQLAYINLLGDKVGLSKEWDGFRGYQPLESSCTDEELGEFVGRQVESYCSFCPAKKEYMKLDSPLPNSLPRI